MSTIFEDKPDERQTDASTLASEHSLFRKRYRQMNAHEIALHDAVKDKADELAAIFDSISEIVNKRERKPVFSASQQIAENQGANVTLALRHLEDAVYRAVKALTA